MHEDCLSEKNRLPTDVLVADTHFNYCHSLVGSPAGGISETQYYVAAITGTVPNQCDQIAMIDLETASLLDTNTDVREFGVKMDKHVLGNCAVIGIRWTACGRFLLANTRPRVGTPSAQGWQDLTLWELLREPPSPLGTGIELFVVNALTMETLSKHIGNHANTIGSPFVQFTDSWAGADFIASGGEDRCVHVWHRRHGRQLQRLTGHTDAVNSVSWSNEYHLLASASDDNTVILWKCSRSG